MEPKINSSEANSCKDAYITEKAKSGESKRLAILATAQMEEIGSLKQEVPLLRRKGGNIYALPPQQLPFDYSENKEKLRK